MSSDYLQYLVLSWLTGSPLLAAAMLLAGYWVVDRFTFRFLPDPVRFVRRFLKISRLRAAIAHNSHDRRARFELADVLVEKKRYREALEVLRSNVEAGDADAPTLFLMGLACLGSGHAGQGEAFLAHAEEADPKFRVGAIDLERGRWRLVRGDLSGAREALERLLKVRKGSVEARVLLARALEASGDDAKAALTRDEAWREYAGAPRFQRRVERFWAWRARPSRPLTYALIALVAAGLFVRFVGPALSEAANASEVSHLDAP